VQQVPLKESEITRITELVKKAVGFDAERQDSINVINIPFQDDVEMESVDEIPFWQQPWLWELVKPVLGALFVLFLGLGVLRPALKNLTESGHIIESESNAQRLPAGEDGAVAGLPGSEDRLYLSSDAAALAGGAEEGAEAADGVDGHSKETQPSRGVSIETARSLVQQDPRRVAQVMKTWVAADE